MIQNLEELLQKIIDLNFDKKTIVYLSVAIELLKKQIEGSNNI